MGKETKRGEELGYVIRPARLQDRAAISRLLAQTWPDYEFDPDRVLNYIVAQNSRNVVGAIYCSRILNALHIFDLVVRQDLRGQGIAAALISKAEELAREKGLDSIHITADITDNDTRLVDYYTSLGFTLIKGTKNRLVKDVATIPSTGDLNS